MTVSIHPAALSAPGLGYHVDLDAGLAAGEVTLDNGVPVSHVVIGYVCRRPVVIESPSLAFLDALEAAIHLERARLALWYPPQVHPFGEDESGAAA